MPFIMSCNNKGCGKQQSPVLSIEDNKVYCAECDNEILNVSPFIKGQMKNLGQTRKDKTKSFSVKCSECNKDSRPNKKDNLLFCGSCSKELKNISPIYKKMYLEILSKIDKDL